jgi:hypothetical protein
MTSGNRITWGLVTDILDALERHGHHRFDDQHTGQAIGVISDLVRVYEGSLDVGYGTYRDQVPSPPDPEPGLPVADVDPDVVDLTSAEIVAVLTALDLAGDYKRDHAETCADCANQSCPACCSRLQDAQAYDRIAVRMLRTVQAAKTSDASQPEPHHPSSVPAPDGHAADREAGR